MSSMTRAIRSAPSDERFDVTEARVGLAQTAIELADESYRLRHQVHGARYADAPGCSPYPMACSLLRLPGNGPAAKKLLKNRIEPVISDHCACCENKITSKPKQGGNNKKKKKGKKKGKLSCTRCNGVYYCGKECQKTHWEKGHEKACMEACAMMKA